MSVAKKQNLNEPLVGSSRPQLEELSERLTESIEGLGEYIQRLEEFDIKLGGKEDNRVLREHMKEEITDGNDEIKTILELFKQFEGLTLKRKDDIEYKNRVMKRTKDSFNKQNEKFTRVLKSIQKKEKIYLQAKQSQATNNFKNNVSAYKPIGEENDFVRSEIQADLHDLDFTEAIIKERREDVHEIRKLAHELNLTAQFQARKLREASQDIELVEDNTRHTEVQVRETDKTLAETLKYQRRSSRKNLILCCLIMFACSVIILITSSRILSN